MKFKLVLSLVVLMLFVSVNFAQTELTIKKKSSFGRVASSDCARQAREVIPDRVFLAVLVCGALDLGGSGRAPPEEAVRPTCLSTVVAHHQPFTAPAMIPPDPDA